MKTKTKTKTKTDGLLLTILVDTLISDGSSPEERAESLAWILDEVTGLVNPSMAEVAYDHEGRLLVAALLADYRSDRACQRLVDRAESYRQPV